MVISPQLAQCLLIVAGSLLAMTAAFIAIRDSIDPARRMA